MAKEVDIVGTLGTVLSAELEKQAKKAQPIPEVYSSGMRGREKPPHLREQKKPKQRTSDDEGEERYTADGKRVVTFKAKPKMKVGDEIAGLKKQIADLTAKLTGGESKPNAAANNGGAGKSKPVVKIE